MIPALFQVTFAAAIMVPLALLDRPPVRDRQPHPEAIVAVVWLGSWAPGSPTCASSRSCSTGARRGRRWWPTCCPWSGSSLGAIVLGDPVTLQPHRGHGADHRRDRAGEQRRRGAALPGPQRGSRWSRSRPPRPSKPREACRSGRPTASPVPLRETGRQERLEGLHDQGVVLLLREARDEGHADGTGSRDDQREAAAVGRVLRELRATSPRRRSVPAATWRWRS